MDIKIGAVFSLAQCQPGQDNQNIETSDEEEIEFIPFDQPEDPPYCDVGENYVVDESQNGGRGLESLNESTESAVSGGNDKDCPPSLPMEVSMPVVPFCENSWHENDVLPPVLERERPEVQESDGAGEETPEQPAGAEVLPKRKCTRILPSYLVLTNVRQALKKDRSISYRRFKRTFKVCSNMCKKTYFRRRLEAGKDVFNVKSHSKQKPYQLFLEKEGEKETPVASTAEKQVTSEKKDMDSVSPLATYDKLKTNKLKDLRKKQSVARRRRMIQHIPKDFRMIHLGVSKGGVTKEDDHEENHALTTKLQHERIMKQLHDRELFNLKAQIRMKRMANKRMEQVRKMDTEKSAMDIVAGTSLKGRKRKINTRYGLDFALTKTEESQIATIVKFEKQIEREQKKRQNKMNNLKRRMSAKASNEIDLVIDNAENNQVNKVKTEGMAEESGYAKKGKRNCKLKVELVNEKMESNCKMMKSGPLKTRRKSAELGDGILIRDLPPEDQVISGILGTGNSDPETPASLQHNPSMIENPYITKLEKPSSDPYTFAKSLLRSSLFAKSEDNTNGGERNSSEVQKLLIKPNTFQMTPDMEMDKAKKLRMPENVRRLFKVKTELADPDEVSSPRLSSPTASYTTSATSTQSATTGMYAWTKSATANTSHCSDKKPRTYTMLSKNVMETPTSTKKSVVFPLVVCQSTPTSSAPPLLMKAGSLPVPVTIASGPNRDKIITVLVSATDQSSKMQASQSVNKSSNLNTTYNSQSLNNLGSRSTLYTNFANPAASMAEAGDAPVYASTGSSRQLCGSSVNTTYTPQTTSEATRTLPFTTSLNTQCAALSSTPLTLPYPVQAKSTLKTTPMTSTSLLTSSSMTSQSQTAKATGAADKCKFYLLKVDGKNILIPMNPSQSETPKAFIVSNDVALKATNTSTAGSTVQSLVTSQKKSPLRKLPIPKVVSSPTAAKLSKLLTKPTATITPCVKSSLESDWQTDTYTPLVKERADFKTAVAPNVVHAPKEIPVFDMISERSRLIPTTVAQVTEKTEKDVLKSKSNVDKNGGKRGDGDFSVKGFLDDVASTTASQQTRSESGQTIVETVIENTRDTEKEEEEKEPITAVITLESEIEENKERPFSEDLTDREEKLRKLKELLKEKQKAVEEMRANRLKIPDG